MEDQGKRVHNKCYQREKHVNRRVLPVRPEFWVAMAWVAAALAPSQAYAMDPVSAILCIVIGIVEGNLGRAIATIAVISIGVTALLGRVTWGQALMVATGIGVIFGAIGLIVLITSGQPCT